MSGNSDNCIFLIVCLGTLETTFGGQKNFPFGRGILSWSETPYFPISLTNGAKVASERRNVRKKTLF